MKPEEFTCFENRLPEPNKWIIVTNNIGAKNAFGEMSHVWMVTYVSQGKNEIEGFVTFDGGDRKIINLTHWRYA